MKNDSKGQILVGALAIMVALLILVPAIVNWVQNEVKWSVKEQKSSTAFNLAEAAIDRGVWKVKSSTGTWDTAKKGIVIADFNFDKTYSDVAGGTYRIRFASGPSTNEITVFGEGRDAGTKETRALQVVYKNMAFPAAMLSGGVITYHGSFEAHWGPVMSQNNITISNNAATEYFPRKFSKQVVTGTGGNPRDTNGINPPNTDNVEWWSDYPVPELPLLDFATMRASAAANGTLNYYTTSGSSGTGKCIGWAGHGKCRGDADNLSSGVSNDWADHSGLNHFFDSNDHALSKSNRIWYWDGDVAFTGNFDGGGGCHRNGLYGTVIVRGNMTIGTGDCYAFNGTIPAEAYLEYKKLKSSQWDSATDDEYPGDAGMQAVDATFSHGTQSWTGGPPSGNTDVGFRGLIYVGGNLTVNSIADAKGVIWVNGNVTNNVTGERVLIFYDDTIDVPVLNVILQRRSWREVAPSTVTWQ